MGRQNGQAWKHGFKRLILGRKVSPSSFSSWALGRVFFFSLLMLVCGLEGRIGGGGESVFMTFSSLLGVLCE